MNCVLAASAPILGGVWRHVLDLAEALQRLNVEVLVLGPESVIPALRDRHSSLKFGALGSSSGEDIFHLHLANTYEDHHGRLIRQAERRGSAVVVTEHLPRTLASDPSILSPRSPGANQWKKISKRVAMSRAHAMISISDEDRDFLIKRYNFPPERITAVPLEINVESNPVALTSLNRFVAAGSIITQKGFDVLVEASAFATSNWTVEVFGEGPHRKRLEDRANQLGGRVRFCGHSNNVLEEMDQSRGVIIPSRWESGPYVLLEAMGRARPVIASRVDAMPRVVRQNDCGLLFEAGNSIELARALDQLTLSGDAERLGQNGYRAASRLSTVHMASNTLEVYRRVLAK